MYNTDIGTENKERIHVKKPTSSSGTIFARKVAVFITWFNGILAPVFGVLMMVDPSGNMAGMESIVPLLQHAPGMPEIFAQDLFWSGIALLLVNGVANIVSIVLRRLQRDSWKRASLVAGILLILWCAYEMTFMPNAISIVYLAIGVLQTICSIIILREERS